MFQNLKNLLLLAFLLGFTFQANAQDTFSESEDLDSLDILKPQFGDLPESDQFKYGVKLMNTTTALWVEYTTQNASGDFETNRFLNRVYFLDLQPGFQIQGAHNNAHEFILYDIRRVKGNSVDPSTGDKRYTNQSSTIDYSYSYFQKIVKNRRASLVGLLGIELRNNISYFNRNPESATGYYPRSEFQLMLLGKFVPRMAYYSKRRFFADISIPIQLFGGRLTRSHSEDPRYSPGAQTSWDANWIERRLRFVTQVSVGLKL